MPRERRRGAQFGGSDAGALGRTSREVSATLCSAVLVVGFVLLVPLRFVLRRPAPRNLGSLSLGARRQTSRDVKGSGRALRDAGSPSEAGGRGDVTTSQGGAITAGPSSRCGDVETVKRLAAWGPQARFKATSPRNASSFEARARLGVRPRVAP